jgi:hypothetical protein
MLAERLNAQPLPLLTDVVVESDQFAHKFCTTSAQLFLYCEYCSSRTLSAIHEDPDLRADALVDELWRGS